MPKTHCKRGHERTPENLYSGGWCKICSSLNSAEWRKNNIEKKREIGRRWQMKNRSYCNAKARRLRKANGEKIRQREKEQRIKCREHRRQMDRVRLAKHIATLSDQYVAKCLRFPVWRIPPEVIDLERQLIIIKREIRNARHENCK